MREANVRNPPPRPNAWNRFGEVLDRAVFVVAPSAGAKRMAARSRQRMLDTYSRRLEDKLGHPAARSTPSRDHRWFGSRLTIDQQIQEDRVELQQRAVEMVQANPHAAGAIEGRVSHEVGVGLAVRPRVSIEDGFTEERAEQINSRLKRVCKQWSRHGVDRRRRLSLSSVQRLIGRTYATYGEAVVLFRDAPYSGPIGLTVEVVNPMRMETPPEHQNDENVSMGVRYHPTTDQIVGYYIRKVSRKNLAPVEYEFVPRYNRAGQIQVVHVFEELFPGQSRGLPWLTAAMAFLKDLDDFHEAELITKQVETCFSLIFQGGGRSPDPFNIAEGNSAETTNDRLSNRLEDLVPGTIHYADEGEEVKVVDPTRPGSTFAPFVEQTLRAGAAALNYPYELLAKNFFRTTYSSGRLAMLDGQLGFRMRAQVLIDQAMSPMWIRVVDDAFFYGHMEGLASRVEYLADRGRFEEHSWGGKSFGAVDPEKEAKANSHAVETGQKTLSEVHAADDKDWSDVMDQRDAELRKDIRLRLEREKFESELRSSMGLPDPNDSDEDDEDQDEREPANQTSGVAA